MAVVNTIADLAAWFGWYVVPFILILSLIVFDPRARALSGRTMVRG